MAEMIEISMIALERLKILVPQLREFPQNNKNTIASFRGILWLDLLNMNYSI